MRIQLNNAISDSDYAAVVDACADDCIALGVPVDDIICSPKSAASLVIGVCNLDALAECVELTVSARERNLFSFSLTGKCEVQAS